MTELQATVALTEALWKLPRVKELTLPRHHELFVTGPDKQIYGCERITTKAPEEGDPLKPGSGEYVFALRTRMPEDIDRQKPFEPGFALVAPKANAMLSAPQQQLDHGRVMVRRRHNHHDDHHDNHKHHDNDYISVTTTIAADKSIDLRVPRRLHDRLLAFKQFAVKMAEGR